MRDWKNILSYADEQDRAEEKREKNRARQEWVIIVSLTALFGGVAILSFGLRAGGIAAVLIGLAIVSTLEMRR